jgi:hypothetical protein
MGLGWIDERKEVHVPCSFQLLPITFFRRLEAVISSHALLLLRVELIQPLYPRPELYSRAKGKYLSRAKSLKDMVKRFAIATERRAQCEGRLARIARETFSDPATAIRIRERITKEADKPEFKGRRLQQLGLQQTLAAPLIPPLLDAAAAESVARSADVRVRDLRSDRASEKLAQARGNRSWDEITYERLGRWEQQDVRQLARRHLDPTSGKRSRQAATRQAFEAVVSHIIEVDGKAPGYTRDPDSGKVHVPALDFIQTAIELCIGPTVSVSAESAVKWLQRIRGGGTISVPWVITSGWYSPSVLQAIPDAEREVMRAESARNLALLREFAATRISTRSIASDDVTL